MGRSARRRQSRLAEKLLKIRAALGLSQNGMLKALELEDELARTAISSFELGDREPPLHVILGYAHLAGVSTDAIIDDDLDLPDKMPCSPKHPGIPRQKPETKIKSKRKA